MSISGRKSIHYIKKDVRTQKTPAIGFKKIKAYHEAALNDTTINLLSLNLPSSTPGYTNPSASDLVSAQIFFNQSNLRLTSDINGPLDWDQYTIIDNNTIQLTTPAAAGELFSIVVDNVAKTGVQMVDSNPVVKTGVLPAGQTEFIVGTPFDVNKYPLQQIGSILVSIDGQQALRNTGNATAAPTADGDYEEVDNGGGIGTIIRFNNSSGSDRSITVTSNGLAFSAPDDAANARIESLSGQVDALVPTVATLAGVPETNFQAAPNYADLAAFGNRVTSVENNLAEGSDPANGPILATNSASGAVSKYNDSGEGNLGTIGNWATVDSAKYRWTRVGNRVDFWWRVESTTPSTSVTALTFIINSLSGVPLPTDFSTQGNSEWVGSCSSGRAAAVSGDFTEGSGGGVYKDGSGNYTIYGYTDSAQSTRIWVGHWTYYTEN